MHIYNETSGLYGVLLVHSLSYLHIYIYGTCFSTYFMHGSDCVDNLNLFVENVMFLLYWLLVWGGTLIKINGKFLIKSGEQGKKYYILHLLIPNE